MRETTKITSPKKIRERAALSARAKCLCGAVEIEIGVPARWAWHDHSAATRKAHGAAYATYVGAWRSKFRIVKGQKLVTRYVNAERARSFCSRCGTPVAYERTDPQMINVPRALFEQGTGREPRYHVAIEELQPWAYKGERLVPLKGFPGVVWERPNRKKRIGADLL